MKEWPSEKEIKLTEGTMIFERPVGYLPIWTMELERWAFEREIALKVVMHWSEGNKAYSMIHVPNEEHRTMVIMAWEGKMYYDK